MASIDERGVDPTSAPDDELLDALLDLAIDACEAGAAFELDRWLEGRDHLRTRAEEVVRLAEDTVLSRPRTLPRLSGYSILGDLGHGGMGQVHLALRRTLGGHPVALKVLPIGFSLSPRARERFLREARALARVSHPHIVTIHEVIEEPGVAAYSMEWVEGMSLAGLIGELAKQSRPPSIETLRQILGATREQVPEATVARYFARVGKDIAGALAAVHDAGLVHRDVKPSNILLRRDGTPLLADFGLVRDEDATLTEGFVGTLAYAPPEQFRSSEDSSSAAGDIYSLCASLYHALSLRPPHAAPDRRTGEEEVPPLSRGERRRSPALADVIGVGLEIAPTRRYATAADLEEDLRRVLEDRPIRGRPPGLLRRTAKWFRRHRRGIGWTTLGMVAMGAFAIGLYREKVLKPRWAEEAERRAWFALLDADMGEWMAGAAFVDGERAGIEARQLRIAEAEFRSAMKWRRDPRIRAQIDLIRRVLDRSEISESSQEDRSSASGVSPRNRPPDDPLTPPEAGAELRGLAALIVGDSTAAIEAWVTLEEPSTPMISAALGQLELAMGRPEIAYPLLAAAVSEFAEFSGAEFLEVDLLDAMIQCNDLDRARFLERNIARRAESFSSIFDQFSSWQRARADLRWIEGETEAARAQYEEILSRHPSLPGILRRLAETYVFEGETEAAIQVLRARLPHTRVRSLGPLAMYAIDSSWAALDEKGRRAWLQRALIPGSPESEHLRLVSHILELIPPNRAEMVSFVRSAERADFRSRLRFALRSSKPLPKTRTLIGESSAPSLESISLSQFVSRWKGIVVSGDFERFLSLPRPLRSGVLEFWIRGGSSCTRGLGATLRFAEQATVAIRRTARYLRHTLGRLDASAPNRLRPTTWLALTLLLMAGPLGAQCEVQEIFAADAATGDAFGGFASLDGEFLFVGAPQDDGRGAVYVYQRVGGNWTQFQKLIASDGTAGDGFGTWSDLDGTVAVIGAQYDGPGSAYVFRFDGLSWVQEQKLTASDGTASDWFGPCAIRGDLAIIGAYADDPLGNNSGSAYIFRYDGASWTQEQKLTPSDGADFHAFGVSVEIRGNLALVGSRRDGFTGPGRVYAFHYDGTNWTQGEVLLGSVGETNDYFGQSMHLDGTTLVIGADLLDLQGGNSGGAFVFRDGDGDDFGWTEEAFLLPPEVGAGDRFGNFPQVSGDRIVIGAFGDDDAGVDAGAAYLYERIGTIWVLVSKLISTSTVAGDTFGISSALDGTTLVVGSFTGDAPGVSDAGSATVFDLSETACSSIVLSALTAVTNGTSSSIPFTLQSSLPIYAFSFGICHDSARAALSSVAPGLEAASFDFYQVDQLADGFTVAGLVNDGSVPTDPFTLDASGGLELAVGNYQALTGATFPGETIPLEFCDTLGTPPVSLTVTVDDGSALGADVVPTTSDGALVLRGPWAFDAPDLGPTIATVPMPPIAVPLTIEDVTGLPLGSAPSTGFQMVLAHDPTILSVDAVDPGAALAGFNGGTGPDFFTASLLPDGFTLAVVYEAATPGTLTHVPADEVAVARYSVVAGAATPAPLTTPLAWSDTLGSPLVENFVADAGSSENHRPTLNDGSLLLTLAAFIRGDCSSDGNVNISDAVAILQHLFGGAEVSCREACEPNGDALVDISDAVYLLSYLFLGGAPPAAPFPACGTEGFGQDCANSAGGCP